MRMDGLTILRIILLVAGTVLFFWFLLPVFITHNPNIGALTGVGISLLLVVYGIWGRQINHLAAALWKSAAGRIVEILLLVICAAILALAIASGSAMLRGAAGKPEPGSTVIVLGARVYENRVSRSLAGRLDAAITFLQDNPESKVIVSGGQGKNEIVTEASVMYDYLIRRGIDPDRVYMEDRSTDTDENLRFSREIIEREGLNLRVALATDGYHAYRAEKYAEKAGLQAETVPAHTIWWLFPASIIREMYGILEQWFLNR